MKKTNFFSIATSTAAIALASLAIQGCSKSASGNANAQPNNGNYASGVFTINQGNFGSGSGTISYYNRSTKAVTTDLFQTINGRPLGNVAQSMQNFNGKDYIVVNNDGKVEVVNASTFASTGTITGFAQPRYFIGIPNTTKGYVSQWGANGLTGSVAVVNLSTNAIQTTIPTGKGAEGLALVGNQLYVANSGGDGNDSTVTVINTNNNAVVASILVGPNPQGIQQDVNGKLWVLCQGMYNANYTQIIEPGRLVRINPTNNTVELSLAFSTAGMPANLVINSSLNTLYYNFNGAVYSQNVSATTLSATAMINASLNGLGIDPTNNYIYGANAGNFSSNGWVIRYTPAGAKVDSFQVGIIPGNFCFE